MNCDYCGNEAKLIEFAGALLCGGCLGGFIADGGDEDAILKQEEAQMLATLAASGMTVSEARAFTGIAEVR